MRIIIGMSDPIADMFDSHSVMPQQGRIIEYSVSMPFFYIINKVAFCQLYFKVRGRVYS